MGRNGKKRRRQELRGRKEKRRGCREMRELANKAEDRRYRHLLDPFFF